MWIEYCDSIISVFVLFRKHHPVFAHELARGDLDVVQTDTASTGSSVHTYYTRPSQLGAEIKTQAVQ